jgi:gas vesicle protein
MQTYSTPTGNGPSTAGGASATDQAKDKAQQAAGQAKEQAQQAAGQAKGALRTQVDQRSTDAGQKVGGFASDVRSVSDQLREQGKDQPAKLADQAADRAEQVSRYLTNSDGDRILGDIEDFGRRQPWAVIGGGVVLGLLASRFLKASSTRRYEERYDASRAQLPARTSYGTQYGTPGQPYTGTVPPRTGTSDPLSTTPGTEPLSTQGSFEGGR